MDILYTAGGFRRYRAWTLSRVQRPDTLADRFYFSHLIVVAWRDQFHHHDYSIACQRSDLDAAAVLRVGAIRHRVSVAAGVPATGSCDRHAVDGPRCAYQLFSAERSQ